MANLTFVSTDVADSFLEGRGGVDRGGQDGRVAGGTGWHALVAHEAGVQAHGAEQEGERRVAQCRIVHGFPRCRLVCLHMVANSMIFVNF